MGAALFRVDAVGEGEHRLGKRVVILDGDLNRCLFKHLLEIERVGLDGAAVAVDVPDQVGDSAVEEIGALDIALASFVMPGTRESDLQALIQVGDLFEVGDQQLKIVFDDREYLRIGLERHRGAVFICLLALHQPSARFSTFVFLAVRPALAADLGTQFLGQGIHHRAAHTVETAGDLVSATAKLTPGMQRGHHRFQGALARLGVFVDGDTTAVVGHRYPAFFRD